MPLKRALYLKESFQLFWDFDQTSLFEQLQVLHDTEACHGQPLLKRSLSTMLSEKLGTSQLSCPQRSSF